MRVWPFYLIAWSLEEEKKKGRGEGEGYREHGHFVLLHCYHARLHGAFDDHPVDGDGARLPNTVDAVDGLIFDLFTPKFHQMQ